MIFAAAALTVQAAVFAPPAMPIRIVTERTEGEWRFRMERVVRFTRDGMGWRAELRLASARAEGPGKVSAMLEAGYSGLAGRTIVFRLDAQGKVIAVEDREVLWEAFCRGIAAIVKTRRPDTDSVVAPFRVLPPERQQRVLASLVSVLIADDAAVPIGVRPVRLPGTSPFGGPISLDGTRNITRAGPLIRSATYAAADVTARDGSPGHVEIEMNRDTDPATGLVAGASETVRTTIGKGPGARRTERTSTVQVTLESDG